MKSLELQGDSLIMLGCMVREKPKMVTSSFSQDIYVDLMHNKFLIMDDKVAVAGSLNWTTSVNQKLSRFGDECNTRLMLNHL
jgi:phosphatidylserine/phosphatidylglycerophosphate/cardiolipin synthase-like enzyme